MRNVVFNSEEVVNKFSEMLYNIAIGYLRNKEDTEDIVQEVFMKFISYTRRKVFNSDDHIKYWLIRVTINLCNNELKSAKRKNKVDITEIENLEAEGIKTEYTDDIVNSLSEKYRNVFRLFYIEGFKISEISKILSISEDSVKTRLKRAREKLKHEWEIGGERDNG